jgi:3-dehydroquinate synthase
VDVVRVNVSKPYDVLIGRGILDSVGERLREVSEPCRCAVITDDIVSELYKERVVQSLEASGFSAVSFVFQNGEQSKTLATFGKALEFLAEQKLSRTDLVVALGGGVVGDLAGFVSSVYLRGVRFIQIPTTLLAAVDSSVGGKTAVDLAAGKNLAGAFYQPELVLCDPDTLSTLPAEFIADGMAEVIKYGMIYDKELFSFVAGGANSDMYERIIRRCVEIKAHFVENDERDNGIRQLLNFGHTAGHAIEKCSNMTITHGNAVAIGMAIVAKACAAMGIAEQSLPSELISCLRNNNLPVECEFTAQELAAAALSDKKRRGGSISVVVVRAVGDSFLKPIRCEETADFFKQGMGEESV